MNFAAEVQADEIAQQILTFAQLRDTPSETLVAGLADVVGMIAATLDANEGAVPISSRLDVFAERAKQSHRNAVLRRQMWLAQKDSSNG